MTEQDSNTAGHPPTHQDRFAEACKITGFEDHPGMLGGYKVWGVSDIVKGGREQFDGPYFTEEEAKISAELWESVPDRRCARADASIHCAAWNPNPLREKAIRDDAVAARLILAEQLGMEFPKQSAQGAQG
jgi:hypothetical protein